MITKPTTLILGAGASAPFGFPTGYGLLQEVLDLTNEGSPLSRIQFLLQIGFTSDNVRYFRELLWKSNKSSVDSFLEHRPEFIEIGKAAMAVALIKYENELTLFNRKGDSWYEYLFSELNATFDDFDKNQLTILTFNYDRSLEHCLLTALMNSYGKTVHNCIEKLNSIPIIHLHGDLGALGFVVDDNARQRPYSADTTARTVRIAASRIKIIHEKSLNEDQFNLAKSILSKSEVICFLGFGYHPLNMERLGFKGSGAPRNPYLGKNINGTTFRLTNAQCEEINRRFGLGLRRYSSPQEFINFDVLQFLKEMGTLYGN